MKKRILCLILTVLLLIGVLPISVFADEIADAIERNATPVVSVSSPSPYFYSEDDPDEYRALPDLEGNFYLDISLDKAPSDGSAVVVYYRTVDDSAVAKWGDYEDVGIEASVTLNRSNGYKARVTVASKILDDGFYTSDESGEKKQGKLVTRRFLFELTSVEGDAELHEPKRGERDQSKLYCYLRSALYHYQDRYAQMIADGWKSGAELEFERYKKEYFDDILSDYTGDLNDPEFLEGMELLNWVMKASWYAAVTGDFAFLYGSGASPEDAELKIPEKYNSLYYTVEGASALNSPHISVSGSHSDNINLSFDEEWQSYVQSGWCDLGISIKGDLVREYWDSDGPATFNLYYHHGGEKKLALTLYLQGEFDDSTHFGWEHAYEYAVEGLEHDNRDDHMDENFIGFKVYDNAGNEAYKVIINGRGELDEIEVCSQLKRTLIDGNAVEMLSGFRNDLHRAGKEDGKATSYYLRLPSDFALADSYSYDFYTESTRTDSSVEIRWLENVELAFTLIGNKQPSIVKDERGNQMVATNLETMREGDPIRMSIRFDRPVHIADPNGNCYVTADIYNDRGSLLARGVKLTLKQLGGTAESGEYVHYAWDTLVFEGDMPTELEGTRIASLRNIVLKDGTEDKANPTTDGIKSFFTELKVLGKSIKDIYVERDFRTPIATVSPSSTDNWSKSKSLDLYLSTESGARFNDYATVYYQWSDSTDTPETYGSKVVFHTNADGEVLKTIIGSGTGEMYLHLKAVSAYGMESESGPFGPFKFDNGAPTLSEEDITVTGGLSEKTVSIPFPNDNGGSGLATIALYYIKKNGEAALIKNFTADDFDGDPKTLSYTISSEDVGVGVDADGKTITARGEVKLYWVLTDKLGNSSGKTAEFSLVFDTNDYLSEDVITGVGPLDFMADGGLVENPQTLSDKIYLYDYKDEGGRTVVRTDASKAVYYAFGFNIDGTEIPLDNKDYYDVLLSFNGVPLERGDYTVEYRNVKSETVDVEGEATEREISWQVTLLLHKQIESGRYDIRLSRSVDSESGTAQVSETYSVYATANENDSTPIKNKVEFGTLLSNTVYQLSAEYPYFYYKDVNGVIHSEYYNGTRQPASFSSFAKAKEYVYYKELGDIYLVELNAATASALISGTTGYLIARGETTVPQEGQYWIRYKSDSWTPTSGESAWVYYYYGTSGVLNEGALSSNLQSALNTVATRIAGYGKTVILTDTSLFLSSAMGDKMLDKYGMPYLAPGQVHADDEFSRETMCGNAWATAVGFAKDKNIYKSNVSVGVEGVEYPLVGSFALPADSIFQYMTYEQYNGGSSSWQTLNIGEGGSFISALSASGVYYIREISTSGISVFPIYIDREAPEVSFSNTAADGSLKEIPVDGKEILDIRTKDLYIGSIAPTEHDTLAYVAVYKVSNLSLVGIYLADDLAAAPIKLEDGNYYIVVADRSGNRYTVTAKVSSTDLECSISESADRFIRLTCNRRSDQIQRYEVYLNGELVTSTYSADQTFTMAGLYTVYIQDIYGNEFSEEHLFVRNYPTVTWKYLGDDGKYHEYDPEHTAGNGFVLTWVYDNQYKISTSVKTRFSFSADYVYEFVGTAPKYTESMSTETMVTIEAGQSFTLKVYYKNHKDCYTIYSGLVDVTPPSISVSAEVEVMKNGEYDLFDTWIENGAVTMDDIYYVLSEIGRRTVVNGETLFSDIIKINANDANGLSLLEVYRNGELTSSQASGFSEIVVNRPGDYRIVAYDSLGNVSEFSFTNGMPDEFDYSVDGTERETDPRGYLNFESIGGKHVYTKVDFGKTDFKLDLKQNADVFMSVAVSGGATEIHGFRISDGQIYSLTYKIVVDEHGGSSVVIDVGEALIDVNADGFRSGVEYQISRTGAYAVYASIGSAKSVSIRVYAPDDSAKIVSVGARVEVLGGNTSFVCAELSKKSSDVSFEEQGIQLGDDIRLSSSFIIDESAFDSERIADIRLYYSRLNDLSVSDLSGKTNIYTPGREYVDEGFYLLIARNRYGNERVYRITISRSFSITSSVTFSDGYKIYYSSEHDGMLYSNHQITLDVLDEDVSIEATLGGSPYTRFIQQKEGTFTYFVFSEAGAYEVKLTDSYGNVITKSFVINKTAYSISEGLLTGYNEKALRRDEGYTNQKLSIDKEVYDSEGIYYLAVQFGDELTVLFDAFSESPVPIDEEKLIDLVGSRGDGVYKVICRNRYGAVVTKDIHYRATPTLRLERTTRSQTDPEVYDLDYAVSVGFWSNNTLSFSTDAGTYVFTVNGAVSECPRTLVFENAGDFGSFEYDVTYIDEYGFEYSFKAYLVRKSVEAELAQGITGVELDGVFNTKDDISITFGENVYATYSRNSSEEIVYRSGDVLKKDGTYRFTVIDYAGNATTMTVKKDTAVEFSLVESVSGNTVQNGAVVNTAKVSFKALNKDSAYIEKVMRNGVVQADFTDSKFTEDGKWELIVCDELGNRSYFSFYIITRNQNGFAYTTPHEYRITEMWFDSGDGVKVSYMTFVNHGESNSSFNFTENGKYTVVMSSEVSGMSSTFEFTVNTNAPDVSLVGCNNGETTINDVTVAGCKVGDRIRIYRAAKNGEELIEDVEITSSSTKVPTITEGGEYRIVVESEAGVQTEFSIVRKHVMNTSGSVFIMVVIGLSVIGLFTGLVYRNKSKTDD